MMNMIMISRISNGVKRLMNRTELKAEEPEMVNGGWSIFDPVKNAIKTAGKWSYDNMIKPAGKLVDDYVLDPLADCLEVRETLQKGILPEA